MKNKILPSYEYFSLNGSLVYIGNRVFNLINYGDTIVQMIPLSDFYKNRRLAPETHLKGFLHFQRKVEKHKAVPEKIRKAILKQYVKKIDTKQDHILIPIQNDK